MKATSYSSKDAERHAEKMRKIKAARDKMMETKLRKKASLLLIPAQVKGNLLLDLA